MIRPKDKFEESFPRTEAFTDCRGAARSFAIELREAMAGFFLTAREIGEDKGGYEFEMYSASSPYHALGDLRGKIRRELSTRYLTVEHGRRAFSHDAMKGRIGYDGIVVDGEHIPFDELFTMLTTYEGFELSLRIVEPSQEK
ncbi:MAG TPA: hypothetical protein VHG91_07820 [Longimicrobium sp.]|nr:hypothetical protein [Longimicrobium sp.]